jgi:hypothetical protein
MQILGQRPVALAPSAAATPRLRPLGPDEHRAVPRIERDARLAIALAGFGFSTTTLSLAKLALAADPTSPAALVGAGATLAIGFAGLGIHAARMKDLNSLMANRLPSDLAESHAGAVARANRVSNIVGWIFAPATTLLATLVDPMIAGAICGLGGLAFIGVGANVETKAIRAYGN